MKLSRRRIGMFSVHRSLSFVAATDGEDGISLRSTPMLW